MLVNIYSVRAPALRKVWVHSVVTAIIAQEAARLARLDSEVAYTTGLLHNLGTLGLMSAYPDEYSRMLEVSNDFGFDLLQTERDLFEIDHCAAGAYLAQELHPGTGAICSRDFGLLLMATDYDRSLCVWGDPSHCWAGENWTRRFTSPFVAPRVIGSHAKNFKFLDGASTGKGGVKYQFRTGLCLETEGFPDAPNKPKFPSTVLRPGQTYHHTMVLRFTN